MPQKRSKFLETRIFGFVIATVVALVILGLSYGTGLFQSLETKVLDTHFALKMSTRGKTLQEGSVYAEKNVKISDDIMIVGVDFNTLSKYGKWPFPRDRHANLIDSFAKIKNQNQRENSLFLDIFFTEADPNKSADEALVRSMKESGRVYLETILSKSENDSAFAPEMETRELELYSRLGTIRNIKGPWKEMESYLSSEPPLPAYTEAIKGYGQANYNYDKDQIYRSQPLIAKSSHVVAEIDFADLKPGYTVDESKFERLAWLDKDGIYHNIDTPLTEAALASLAKTLEREAPSKVEDTNGDGQPDSQHYIIRKFQDYFIPAITLSLALNYFGKSLDDIDIVLGDRIRIPSPTRYDPETGQRVPYEVQVTPDEFDANGNLVKAGTKRVVPQIDIPIDANGLMLINYMGYPSSDTPDGPQTFPVRSYSGYADKAPKPDQDPETWRRSLAAGNKIVMVGAFAKGMAADEKPTPFGLMYGIEVHANALNTIIMDNFIHRAPAWFELAILAFLVFLVAFLSSRLSTIISFFGTMILLVVYFFGVNITFEQKAFLINFTTPALAMVFTFISIVVYRAMTEQRDKERIRATFGKYLSPKVVDQLVDDPPELGGVDKELSVLFSDIRSFTTLSESMTPQELVNHLNTYLTAMTNVILEDGGYLDKYVGDEVMCFWGAPLPQADHALRACRCALRQMAKLRELNAGWPEAIRINIGIGINSGIMTVGNMGSPAKMNYTLMGDNVNLGARLEGTNKEYGTNIIISEYTYGLVKEKVIVRELDNIRVKGKNKPVVIYELIDMAESPNAPGEMTSNSVKKR